MGLRSFAQPFSLPPQRHCRAKSLTAESKLSLGTWSPRKFRIFSLQAAPVPQSNARNRSCFPMWLSCTTMTAFVLPLGSVRSPLTTTECAQKSLFHAPPRPEKAIRCPVSYRMRAETASNSQRTSSASTTIRRVSYCGKYGLYRTIPRKRPRSWNFMRSKAEILWGLRFNSGITVQHTFFRL